MPVQFYSYLLNAYFNRFILKLHRWLLITGGIGKTIVGIAVIIFSVILITGIVMWWPKKNSITKAFTIKWKSNFFRFNYDLHNVLGFYSSFILLLIALSGLYFSFPWYRNGILILMGKEIQKKEINSVKLSEMKPEKHTSKGEKENRYMTIPWNSLLREAEKNFSYQGAMLVRMPRGKSSVLTIRRYSDNNTLGIQIPDQLLYDLNKNKVVGIQYFNKMPFHKQFQSLVFPIHTGEIFGWPSMIAYFIVVMIGCSLPVTGTIIWYTRNSKK